MLPAIFISYRRKDSEGEAGRLSDVLSHRFGEHSVFMDVDAIQPGLDFRKVIEESIQNCAVLLAVLGPDWLGAQNARGARRLEETNDYVRLEIAAALRRGIPVIPLLIRGAKVPVEEELPLEISDLAYRNGLELSHARWKDDLQVLIRAIEPYMAQAAAEPQAQPAAAPPRLDPFSAHLAPSPGAPPQRPVPASKEAAPAALPDGSVGKVSKLLAHYIGPIAEVVVKRAARSCTSLPALCSAVAEEIESPAERKKFLSHFDQ